MKKLILDNKKNPWFWAFSVIIIVLLFLMPILSRDAGMSGDEHFHVEHAENVLNYYKTFGKDTTAVTYKPEWNLPQYGQTIDNLASLVAKVFNIEDVMSVRHIVNSLCGWLAILIAGLMCFRLTNNWRAAVFGALLLFLSPRFLGHSFNNLKDVPLAVFMFLSVYLMIIYFQEFPKVKKSTLIWLTVVFGVTLAIRVGGLLVIPYFGLFAIVYFFMNYKWKDLKKPVKENLFLRMVFHGLIILIGGLILAMLLWPYILVSPFAHLKETFLAMSSFGTSIRQIFEGQSIWSDSMPWYYTPKYILITSPIAVFIGMLIYPFVGGCKKKNLFYTIIVYFTFFFPVFWIVYTNANVYGGWRHSLFAYPTMTVAAGLGFNALIDFVKNKYLKIVFTVFPFVLLIGPFAHILRNHPYEYVYFNELAGGMKKAYGNYEMDYYYHSTREASEWVLQNAQKSGLETGNKIKVTTWHQPSVNYYFRKDTANFEVTFSRWYERANNDWDYAIFTVTGISPERIKGEYFPPLNTVYTIDVDKKPIAIVLKRDDKSDYYGYLQMQQGNADSAITLFDRALQIDPHNEVVLSNMANIYLQRNNLDSALYFLNRFLEIDPNRESEKYLLAYINYYKGDLDKALSILKQMTDYNKKFTNAYNLAAEIYIRKNDIYSAEKEYLKLMDVGMLDQNSFNQLMRIYTAQGLNERTAQRKIFKRLAESYKKLGNKEAAKMYEEQASRL